MASEAVDRLAQQFGEDHLGIGVVGKVLEVGWLTTRTVSRDGTPHDLALFQDTVNLNLVGTFNTVRLAAQALDRRFDGGIRVPLAVREVDFELAIADEDVLVDEHRTELVGSERPAQGLHDTHGC